MKHVPALAVAVVVSGMVAPAPGTDAGTWQAESLSPSANVVVDPAAVGGKAVAVADQAPEAWLLKDQALSIPQPGKHVLVFRMKVEHSAHLGTPIVARAYQSGQEIGAAVWFGAHFTRDARYQDLALPVEVRASEPVRVTLGWRPVRNMNYYLHQYLHIPARSSEHAPVAQGDLGRVWFDQVGLRAKNQTAGISSVRCRKIHLRRDETQHATVVVSNYTASAQRVELAVEAVTRIDAVRRLGAWSLTLPAHGSRTVTHAWSVGGEAYGRQVRAVLRRGPDVLDRREAYFGVSDNIWQLGIRARHHVYNVPGRHRFILPDPPEPVVHYLHWSGLCTPERIERWFRTHIDGTYVNVIEKFSWAPDQFSDMTPETDTWRSGQGTYYESKPMLKRIIRTAHERGVKVTTYGYGTGGGPPAYEFARRHPEWVCYQKNGRLWQAVFNTKWFEDWPGLTPRDYYSVWPRIQPNFAHPQVLEKAIDELIGSIDMFGWDGVRYDGHAYYVWGGHPDLSGRVVPSREVDRDVLSTRNVMRTKRRVHAKHPHFAFGYNWGPIYPKRGAKYPKTYAACLGNGGMRLNEQVIMAYRPERPGHRWRDYAHLYATDASHAIRLGGHYWVMCLKHGHRMDVLHQAVLSLSARCHLYNFSLGPDVFGDLARFATRYSYYLWDPALEPVNAPEQLFSVQADRMPIWRPLVYRRKTARGAQIVMHLVNAPVEDTIGANTQERVPPVVPELVIRVRDRALAKALTRATVLSLDAPAEPRPVKPDGDRLRVRELRLWNILVIDTTDAGG